jgi:hypothetical protein
MTVNENRSPRSLIPFAKRSDRSVPPCEGRFFFGRQSGWWRFTESCHTE